MLLYLPNFNPENIGTIPVRTYICIIDRPTNSFIFSSNLIILHLSVAGLYYSYILCEPILTFFVYVLLLFKNIKFINIETTKYVRKNISLGIYYKLHSYQRVAYHLLNSFQISKSLHGLFWIEIINIRSSQ